MPIAIRLAVLVLAFLPMAVRPTAAGVTEAWVQRYSNTGYTSSDQAFKVARDGADDFFVVGATADNFAVQGHVIIKYSGADGSVIWQRRYDGPAETMATNFELLNLFQAAVDGNGDLVVATRAEGTNGGFGGVDNGDFYTAKYSGSNGDRLWERRYTGRGSDVPTALALDAGGNVVVTGESQEGLDYPWDALPHRHDYYTAKYAAADGSLLWERRYMGPAQGDDLAKAVAVDADGNVVVTGSSKNGPDNQFNSYDQDIYTAKYAAADGALVWERRYNGPANGDDGGQAVTVDASGNVAVAGYARTVSSLLDFYTVKYAGSNGAVLWEKLHDGTAHGIDSATAMAMDPAGNVIVTGFSDGSRTSYDYLTAKYAAMDGALLWVERVNGPGNAWDLPLALALDAGGNVVVTGCSSGVSGTYDFYTAKYAAATGALLWETRYNGPANGSDVGKSVALDTGGNAVVTGYSLNANVANGFYTVKYAAEDGTSLWENPHHYGPFNLSDTPNAVAVDAAGNVVVTGGSGGEGTASDYYTAKYAAANGALVWERRYNSPANAGDAGEAVVVDGSGNVVVTGRSAFTSYTARYAAADGALLWEKSSASKVTDLAVDAVGNVVVTGGGIGPSATNDFHTAKYAAATGALLWERHYNGPANGSDGGRAVAVDSAGNVVVTGSSPQTGLDDSPLDLYTAKYAADTGALLWDRRFHSASNLDFPLDVVVDADGNVMIAGMIYSDPYSGYFSYAAKYAAADGTLLWEIYLPADLLANAVAVDASGNLAVTGSSRSASPGAEFYTAKFAGATGALLWEKRRALPLGGYGGQAIAMDAAGTVVVSGSSFEGLATRTDIYAAAYAGADGALLWEKTYNGPASGDDTTASARSLALGPDGMVAITCSSDGAFSPSFMANDYATVVYRPSMPPLSFAAWAAGFDLSGSSAAADADPDRDGVPNAVEFTFGRNPMVPDTSGRPTATISGGTMLFTFSRDDFSETPDVSVVVETSTDLLNWSGGVPGIFFIGSNTADSSRGVTISENGTAPDTISVSIPQGTVTGRFARLKVTIAP